MLLHFPREITLKNYQAVIEKRFIHLGVMEAYQTSINKLAEKLGKKRLEVDHLNKSCRYQQPSEGSVRKFKERHTLEYRIYEYAIALNE